jgi:hypothetical protein
LKARKYCVWYKEYAKEWVLKIRRVLGELVNGERIRKRTRQSNANEVATAAIYICVKLERIGSNTIVVATISSSLSRLSQSTKLVSWRQDLMTLMRNH